MHFKETCVDKRNWVGATQEKGYWRALVNMALKPCQLEIMESVSANIGLEHRNSSFILIMFPSSWKTKEMY